MEITLYAKSEQFYKTYKRLSTTANPAFARHRVGGA